MNQLSSQTYPADFDLVIYDEVDSTSDALRRMLVERSRAQTAVGSAPKGQSAGEGQTGEHSANPGAAYLCCPACAVMALRQTRGRGRLGRRWVSPPGGLYVSVALDITEASRGEPALSLIVGLALRAVLAEFIVQEQAAAPGALDGPQLIQLKWPNDIVCARGKLAGILVEAVQLTPARKVAIVGLGVNITPPTGLADDTARSHRSGASQDPAASHASAASHDPAAPIPAARAPLGPATPAPQSALAYLSQLTSPAPEPQRLAQSVLAGIIAQYRIWRSAGYRFAQFRQDFNANLALLDTEATVSNSRGEVLAEGIICGVDDDGCLLLADESDSLLHISTGEVTLRRQRA